MLTIADAKLVPLEDCFAYIAKQYPKDKRGQLSYQSGRKQYYYAIDRLETKASIVVDTKKNTGHDYGKSKNAHFNSLDLMIDYLEGDRQDKRVLREALQLLEAICPSPVMKHVSDDHDEYSERYKIVSRGDLAPRDHRKNAKLRMNLAERMLNADIAREFIDHAVVKDTKTGVKQDCFVWDNIKGGTEVSKPGWKTCIGPKGINVYPQKDGSAEIVLNGNGLLMAAVAEVPKYKAVVIFVGEWDRQTYLTMGGMANLEPETVYSFFDNDDGGAKAQLEFCDEMEAIGWTVMAQNHIYEGYKDLNKWWSENTQEHYKFTNVSSVKMQLTRGQKPRI